MTALGVSLPGEFSQAQDGIVAKPSGTNLTSTQLVYGYNKVTVSVADTDGVLLPPAERRAQVVIYNADSAQAVKVFGSTYVNNSGNTVTDTINGTAGTTGIATGVDPGTVAFCFCATDGKWDMFDSVATTGMVIPT
jgi:hypothetical protein